MPRISKTKVGNDYKKLIPEYSDEEIIKILKKRSHYVPEAAQLAIEEAVKRNIIHSENDLMGEEYRIEPIRFSLFPHIEEESIGNKIRRSIARGMVISGTLPTIWGLLKINAMNRLEGIVVLVFGVLWIFCSARLIRKYQHSCVGFLFAGLLAAMGYVGFRLFYSKSISFMDAFIPLVLSLFVAYGLLYLMRLAGRR